MMHPVFTILSETIVYNIFNILRSFLGSLEVEIETSVVWKTFSLFLSKKKQRKSRQMKIKKNKNRVASVYYGKIVNRIVP